MRYVIEGGKDDEQKEEWFTGWRTRDTGDHPVVIEVERDSPAWKAGVVAGDILVAANGLRLTPKDINDKLWLMQQAPIKLSVFRRDELRDIMLIPNRQVKGKAKVKAVDAVTEEQKALNAAWLGVAWPAAKPASGADKAKE
jgi:predicted metalloprotease with PDZ domain